MTKAIRDEFPKVQELLQSTSLRIHIRNRLHKLKMWGALSEEDVIHHVVLCLVETLQSGKIVPYPIAWARVVSQRYIKSQYDKYQGFRTLESEKIEYFLNRHTCQKADYAEEGEIHRKIQQIKPANRKIIIWRFFDNYSWEEIAELLSQEEQKTISPTTARKRGERALDELRKKYL